VYKNSRNTRTWARDPRIRIDHREKLTKLIEASFVVLTGNGILTTQEFGHRPPVLSDEDARKTISRRINGGKNHLKNLGYPIALITTLPHWFLISPRLTLTIRRLVRTQYDQKYIPIELESFVRWSVENLPKNTNCASNNHSQDSNLSPRIASALGEALKEALKKS